jgi:hypothetical protein
MKRPDSSGPTGAAAAGHSCAAVDGADVRRAGTTASIDASMHLDAGPIARCRPSLGNAAATLLETPAPIFGEYLGRARPAATASVRGPSDERVSIEIEVARLPQ